MTSKLKAGLCCLMAAIILSTAPASATPAETFSMRMVDFSSADLRGVGVYEAGNKVFVGEIGDPADQRIHVLDGTTGEIITTIDGLSPSLGGDLIVNETYGRVFYYNSDSTGVIDAVLNTVISESLPEGILVHDETNDRLFIVRSTAIEYWVDVYDIATGQVTPLSSGDGNIYGAVYNPTSDELGLVCFYPAKLLFIDVSSGVTADYDITESGGNHALTFEVNPIENKYYTTLMTVPGQSHMGISIYDRDSGVNKYVGEDDLEPLVYNPASNTLFSGVQVGTTMGIVDGASDEFQIIDVINNSLGGHAAGAVRQSSDHAYFANQNTIVILDGLYNTVDFINLPIDPRGGGVGTYIDINQSTGQVYVISDNESGLLFVLQDTPSTGTGDLFQDGGFEADTPNPYWRVWGYLDWWYAVQCDPIWCDVNGPHSGSQWAQLGGFNWHTTVSQTGVIPVGMKSLTFWLRKPNTGISGSGDKMWVIIDGSETLFMVDGESSGYGAYKKVSLDITDYADGNTHRIDFYSISEAGFSEDDPGTYFLIDDVALEIGSPQATNTPGTTITPGQTAIPTATVTAGPPLDEHIYLPMGIRNWVGE